MVTSPANAGAGTSASASAGAGVGELLRTWRRHRRLSQLELSHRAEVSTRHLSFVETGRSQPRPEMILQLAEHLDVPLVERNRLLLAGGFAPRFAETALDDASLEVVMGGLRQLLDAHLPFPALLIDDTWDVVDTNAAIDILLADCDPALLEPPVNALRLTLHPDGLAPRIRNLAQWAAHLQRQVAHRADRTHDPRLAELASELAGYEVPGTGEVAPSGPVLALEIDSEAGPLRFFSVSARLETATDTTLEGLSLETFLPADAATAAALRSATTP